MSDAPEDSPSERGSDRADAENGRADATDADETAVPDAGAGDVAADTRGRHAGDGRAAASGSDPNAELEELRRQVDEKYDFENFGPADMAEMTLEEWEVAFDPETWITGEALLDRVEDDLATRVANREVFARVERHDDPPSLVAYSDEGYAVVYPDGSVTGEGTVLRDVKPTVALASMESYDVPEPPADATLPEPEEVPEQSGELGNLMLQVIAGIQLVAALIFFAAGGYAVAFQGRAANVWLLFAAGIAFLLVGLLLFFTVANARLSDAFRAEEYRNRLRAVGSADDGRPEFLPSEPAANEDDATHPIAEFSGQGSGRDSTESSGDAESSPLEHSDGARAETSENEEGRTWSDSGDTPK